MTDFIIWICFYALGLITFSGFHNWRLSRETQQAYTNGYLEGYKAFKRHMMALYDDPVDQIKRQEEEIKRRVEEAEKSPNNVFKRHLNLVPSDEE